MCIAANLGHAGDIVGRVVDGNTGAYLPGASVVVVGTGQAAVTDSQGRFRFGNVAAGAATLRAQYVGYETKTEAVTVPTTGSASVSILLGTDVIQMQALVVEGYREGRSRALQQKRSANFITDIISADSVGSLPDRNVAEALSRVTGISLDVIGGDGEGRFVSIRGMEPNFNNVTLNGATLAPPSVGGRQGRAMPLDVISSSQISQIEVVKSVTPDMDGNALGGSINIKTASGFDRRERFIHGSVEVGKNSEADDRQYRAELTYGNTFAEGKVGVAVSANYSERPYVSHDIQANWAQANNQWYLRTLELQPATGEKVRKGVDFNFELRPEEGTEWYVRGIYNEFNQKQREEEYIMERESDPVFTTPTVVSFNRMTVEQRDFRREIDQTLFNITAGGLRQFGDLTFMGDLTFSYSEEDVPFIQSVQFRRRRFNMPDGRPYQFGFSHFVPTFNDQDGFGLDPALFALRRFREDDSLVEEKTWTPRLDVRKDFTGMFGGRSGFLKTGVKATLRTRFVNDNSTRPVNDDLTLANVAPPGPGYRFFDDRYLYPRSLDVRQAFAYLNANRGQFSVDPIESVANSIEDDYDIDEDIYAIFGMASIKVSDRLNLIAGLRYERTEANLVAFEFQEGEMPDPNRPGRTIETGEAVRNEGSFSYDNFLPNLQFTFQIDDRSILRGAFTGTIGRPQYEKAAPIAALEFELRDPLDPTSRAGALEIGNPSLQPYESLNFDIAYEYYLPAGGLLSIGGFHKRIDNPIYTFRTEQENVIYNGLEFEQLDTRREQNADSARLTGLELGVSLPFSTFFQTGFFEGFGLDLNATFIESDVTIPERSGQDLPFFRQPERIFNAAIYYQKYRFSARVAYNRQTESLRNLGNNSNDDHWDVDREFTDLQASYKLSENFTVYANWQNIFDDRADRTYGRNTGRVRRAEFYGSYVNAGIRFRY